MKFTMISRPHFRQVEPAIAPPTLGVSTRPRLVAQWVVGQDGRLTCQWNKPGEDGCHQ